MGTSPPPPKWAQSPNFWPMSVVTKQLDGSRCHLVRRYASAQQHCVRWGPSFPLQKRGTAAPHFSAHVYCGQMAGWIKMPFGTEAGLGPGHTVLDGDAAPPQKTGTAPNFWPMSVVAKRLDGSRYHLVQR